MLNNTLLYILDEIETNQYADVIDIVKKSPDHVEIYFGKNNFPFLELKLEAGEIIIILHTGVESGSSFDIWVSEIFEIKSSPDFMYISSRTSRLEVAREHFFILLGMSIHFMK